MPTAELTELVSRAIDGDGDAFESVASHFWDKSVRYADFLLSDHHLAEDAVQEAFLEAHSDIGTVREPAAFPKWLRQLVFKQCDRITRRPQLPSQPLGSVEESLSDSTGPYDGIAEHERHAFVRQAVQALPPDLRRVVELHYFTGLKVREVGHVLSRPEGGVKERLYTARKRLSKQILSMVKDNVQKEVFMRGDAVTDDFELFIKERRDKVDDICSMMPSLEAYRFPIIRTSTREAIDALSAQDPPTLNEVNQRADTVLVRGLAAAVLVLLIPNASVKTII